MQGFSDLSQEELNELIKTPLYVGLLIAHADGEADHKELEWIEKVTFFRIKTAHYSLRAYYQLSNEYIKENLKLVESSLPTSLSDKLQFLSDKIASVNPILNKLNPTLKERLVDSYRHLGLSVAEISGSLLAFFSHNPGEEKWLGLDMLD